MKEMKKIIVGICVIILLSMVILSGCNELWSYTETYTGILYDVGWMEKGEIIDIKMDYKYTDSGGMWWSVDFECVSEKLNMSLWDVYEFGKSNKGNRIFIKYKVDGCTNYNVPPSECNYKMIIDIHLIENLSEVPIENKTVFVRNVVSFIEPYTKTIINTNDTALLFETSRVEVNYFCDLFHIEDIRDVLNEEETATIFEVNNIVDITWKGTQLLSFKLNMKE